MRSELGGGRVVGTYRDVDIPDALMSHRGRLIVLVHGFKTSRARALQGWLLFDDRFRRVSKPSAGILLCGLHWPGDHPWPFFSAPTFSMRISDAEQSGDRLARVLWNLPATEIILVGHSLGCRAVLQSLLVTKAEAPARAPRISHAFLMAAAVGEADCDRAGVFSRRRVGDAKQVVFHSSRDRVLRHLFGLGTLPYNGLRGVAVGRFGAPEMRWDRREDTGLGHGEYWKSWFAAQQIAETLGINWERRVIRLLSPPGRMEVDARSIPEQHQAERQISLRL